MTVVVLNNCIPAVPVGIKALCVALPVSAVDFVELHDRVVGAPRPDADVVALRALIGAADDVVFDERAIGRDIHNAIAANVIQHVVANHDPKAGIPLRPHPMRRPAKDPAAVDVGEMIVLDA